MERRKTAKGILKDACGKDIERNLISAIDKVDIMEYLLSCSMDEVIGYNRNQYPSFIVSCALLLANNHLKEYMGVLEKCRRIAKKDNFMQN